MGLNILYTLRSKETFASTYYFIQNEFGDITADKFKVKAEKTIRLIAQQPYMFKAIENDKNVRLGLITKQTSLLYRVTNDSIHILVFWDNRQEPILTQL